MPPFLWLTKFKFFNVLRVFTFNDREYRSRKYLLLYMCVQCSRSRIAVDRQHTTETSENVKRSVYGFNSSKMLNVCANGSRALAMCVRDKNVIFHLEKEKIEIKEKIRISPVLFFVCLRRCGSELYIRAHFRFPL